MNTQLLLYASLMLIGTVISSVAQVLLKKEAGKEHESVIKEYLNLPVIIAYLIFLQQAVDSSKNWEELITVALLWRMM